MERMRNTPAGIAAMVLGTGSCLAVLCSTSDLTVRVIWTLIVGSAAFAVVQTAGASPDSRQRNLIHHPDHETWLIDCGHAVIAKKVEGAGLSPVERLVYCLWVADYGMRNAGDLGASRDLHHEFQHEAAGLAAELDLGFTRETFALSSEALQKEYFERFDRICGEIQSA